MSNYFKEQPAKFDYGIMRFDQVDEYIDGHHIKTFWKAKPVSEGGNAHQWVTIEEWGEGYLTTIYAHDNNTKVEKECGPFDTIQECVRAAECEVVMSIEMAI